MVGGRTWGGERLRHLSVNLRRDLFATLDRIGRRGHHVVEAAVVANFEKKRPEWPGYKNARYEAHRLRHRRTQMLVFHGQLKGSIESDYLPLPLGIIWCGVPGGVGGKIQVIARAQEFGTATVQERSFLRTGAEDSRPELQKIVTEEFKETAAGWSAGR